MKRYTVAQVRDRIATALDEAADGIPVVIERRGVRFFLTAEPQRAPPRRGKSRIDTVDPAIAAGQWHWTRTKKGLTFKRRGSS